jgi:hypothetical protein
MLALAEIVSTRLPKIIELTFMVNLTRLGGSIMLLRVS